MRRRECGGPTNIIYKGAICMIEPYLNLKGQASEAIDFYEGVFGGIRDKFSIDWQLICE